MVGFVEVLVAFGVGHFHLFVGGQLAIAGDDIHIVLLEQVLHTLAHGVGHAAAAGNDRFHVGFHFAFHLDAVVLGMINIGVDLCALQQGFGGDTAPVEADASHFGLLDHSGLLSKL